MNEKNETTSSQRLTTWGWSKHISPNGRSIVLTRADDPTYSEVYDGWSRTEYIGFANGDPVGMNETDAEASASQEMPRTIPVTDISESLQKEAFNEYLEKRLDEQAVLIELLQARVATLEDEKKNKFDASKWWTTLSWRDLIRWNLYQDWENANPTSIKVGRINYQTLKMDYIGSFSTKDDALHFAQIIAKNEGWKSR